MKVLASFPLKVVFLLTLFAFTEAPEESWETYTYRSGNFRVSLPGTPETRKERVMTIKSKSEGIYYMISFNQLERPSQDARAIEQALREGAGTYARNLGGEVEYNKTTELNGLPARELRMRSANGVYIIYRIAISQDRVYQLSVMSALDYPDGQKANQFFSSFELLSR